MEEAAPADGGAQADGDALAMGDDATADGGVAAVGRVDSSVKPHLDATQPYLDATTTDLVQAKQEATVLHAGGEVEAARAAFVQAKQEASAAHDDGEVEAARPLFVQLKQEAAAAHSGGVVQAAGAVFVQAKHEASAAHADGQASHAGFGTAACSASPRPVRDHGVDPRTLRLEANGAPVHGEFFEISMSSSNLVRLCFGVSNYDFAIIFHCIRFGINKVQLGSSPWRFFCELASIGPIWMGS